MNENQRKPPETSQAPSKHCAKSRSPDAPEEEAPSAKPLFRIVPVDPKNTLNFEDTADK
jgi:hypothetical protein